jgi:hypothetical protein
MTTRSNKPKGRTGKTDGRTYTRRNSVGVTKRSAVSGAFLPASRTRSSVLVAPPLRRRGSVSTPGGAAAPPHGGEPTVQDRGAVQELTPAQGRALLDERSQLFFRVGIDEFAQGWRAGRYGAVDENPEALELALLLPMIGVDPWGDGERS